MVSPAEPLPICRTAALTLRLVLPWLEYSCSHLCSERLAHVEGPFKSQACVSPAPLHQPAACMTAASTRPYIDPMNILSQSTSRAAQSRIRSTSYIFSPCIVATTFLLCLCARNSRYQMPCHVPVASFPLVIGTVTLAPTSADLICAFSNQCTIPAMESGCSLAYHPGPRSCVCTDCPCYLLALSDPVHPTCLLLHQSPSSHLMIDHRMCVAQKDGGCRLCSP